jgi:hypothetical protein
MASRRLDPFGKIRFPGERFGNGELRRCAAGYSAAGGFAPSNEIREQGLSVTDRK